MNCTICCENIKSNEKFVILSCKCPYSYHENCLNKWLKMSKSCPTCRNKWIPNPFTSNEIKSLIKRRRHATSLDESQAEELQRRLFLESIGVNSSRSNNTLNNSLPSLSQFVWSNNEEYSLNYNDNGSGRLSPISNLPSELYFMEDLSF